MARMLGTFDHPRCPYCRTAPGPDCATKQRAKKAQRALEKRQWRREAGWPA
jgi:hypothetical protein